MKTKLYIAYGSNLNLQQMARRCPESRMIGKTMLEGWRLTFRNHATIEPDAEARTPVGVWEIGAQCERALDAYEGFPGYYRKETLEIEINGETKKAVVYIMNGGRLAMPTQTYVECIWEGYKDFGLDHTYLEQAMKDTMARIRNQAV